jgi:NADPH:quinone reductase-like Zn-dependent oxidoreductase
MRGWHVREFGGLDAMRWETLPMPEPGAGQLRVRVHASGINFAETRMRAGTYSGQELPFTMGMEAAGVVDALGPGVTGWRVGDRVFGRARGAHAEYVLMGAEHALPIPDGLDWVGAAAVPVGWLTAWHAVVTVANVQPGTRVLIEAVASSVGSAALQIAKWRGAWTAGTASRDDKLARAREWGADALYNYRTDYVPARVHADTNGAGIDVGLMTIGEETAAALFDSMAPEGRIVMYGSTGGRQVCFSLNIGTRNLSLHSMSISTSARFLPETMRTFRDVALPLFANGTFRPVVDLVLPIAQLADAHRAVDARTHFGKIVLTVP